MAEQQLYKALLTLRDGHDPDAAPWLRWPCCPICREVGRNIGTEAPEMVHGTHCALRAASAELMLSDEETWLRRGSFVREVTVVDALEFGLRQVFVPLGGSLHVSGIAEFGLDGTPGCVIYREVFGTDERRARIVELPSARYPRCPDCGVRLDVRSDR